MGGRWEWGGSEGCDVDHILQEFNTLFPTRFRTYKIASPPSSMRTGSWLTGLAGQLANLTGLLQRQQDKLDRILARIDGSTTDRPATTTINSTESHNKTTLIFISAAMGNFTTSVTNGTTGAANLVAAGGSGNGNMTMQTGMIHCYPYLVS